MYVCMYTYIYIYLYTPIKVYTYISTYAHIFIYIHTHNLQPITSVEAYTYKTPPKSPEDFKILSPIHYFSNTTVPCTKVRVQRPSSTRTGRRGSLTTTAGRGRRVSSTTLTTAGTTWPAGVRSGTSVR